MNRIIRLTLTSNLSYHIIGQAYMDNICYGVRIGRGTQSVGWKAIKQKYEEQRENERKKLSDFFVTYFQGAKKELRVIRSGRAGKGSGKYNSGGRIAPYDLKNWKWVEVQGINNSFNCIVSLNMLEVDPHSANPHALFDRIGLTISFERESNYYETKIFTDIELPLEDSAMERIAELISEQFAIFKT